MTEHPGQQPANGLRPGGRHHRRSTSGRNRAVTILVMVVAIVGAAGLVTWFIRSGDSADSAAVTSLANSGAGQSAGAPTGNSDTPTGSVAASAAAAAAATDEQCPLPDGVLTVAAAPDIAGTVADLAAADPGPAGCQIVVTPADPAAFAAGDRSSADVWIPDSSRWIATAAAAGFVPPPSSPSAATSPLILALPAATATRLAPAGGTPDVAAILASRKTAAPVRVGLPDPERSAASVGAILATRAAVTGTSDARAALTWAVRSSPTGMAVQDGENLDRLTADPNTAVPVSEQAVVAHNADTGAGAARAVAIYPAAGGTVLDYPVVALSTDGDTDSAVGDLVRLLTSPDGRAALLAAGFRAPDGTPGATLTAELGVNPNYRATDPLPDAQAISDAIRSVQVTNEPSRMLSVMDISGSMLGVVPDARGATRLDLAREAATRGLALYGPDSDIGLWVFSRTLTMDSDHRELLPIGSLGPDQQGGGSGAQRLSQALAGLQAVPDGGTGLYDTVLDAVRAMRAGYDPSRVNAVLVLTDGMNDDQGSISLDGLLSTLAAEQDPTRPVPVISLAFGPDSDVNALSQISRVTGGATYESRDPRQIGEIFLDAVGQRLCRPSC